MKAWFVVTAVLAAVAIGIEYALAHWLNLSLPRAAAFAPLTTKLALLLLNVASFGVVVLGVLHLAIGRRSGMGQLLAVVSWLAPLVGVLAALQEGLVIVLAVQHSQTHNFRVIGPSVVEALLPLAMGLFVGALAAGAVAFARGARRQAAT